MTINEQVNKEYPPLQDLSRATPEEVIQQAAQTEGFIRGAKWVMEQTIYFLETNSRFPNDMIERYKKFMEK